MLNLMNLQLKHFFFRDCSSGWHLDEHTYHRHALALITRGSILYKINQNTYQVEAGHLVYMPANSIRQATPSEDCLFVAMDFDLQFDDFYLPTVTAVSLTDRVYTLLNAIEFSWLQISEADRVRSHLYFFELLYELLYNKLEHHPNRHVDRMKRYVADHFAETITVESIAEYIDLSPTYCGTLFKQEEGRTILDYVNHIRINHATILLTEGGYSISQVADLCGFRDVYYFSKTFKKIMGVSPKKYWSDNHY